MSLIRDEQLQRRHTAQDAAAQAAAYRDALLSRPFAEDVSNTWKVTALNSEMQRGRVMGHTALEDAIRRLNPSLLILPDAQPGSNLRHIYRPAPGAGIVHCASYESGHLPEHSVLTYAEDEVYDPNYIHYKGSDFKGGRSPHKRTVRTVHSEAIRGWRTVLIRLRQQRLIEPWKVEALFGRPSYEDGPGYQNWMFWMWGIGKPAY